MSECECHLKLLKIKIYITTFVRESHSYGINSSWAREREDYKNTHSVDTLEKKKYLNTVHIDCETVRPISMTWYE